ncbi:MAG: hypothetical protein EXQ85_02100 [Alphaproteobacteria bacterium]|nr:hypothetical protein [Alphaproteobacteria bacterium]
MILVGLGEVVGAILVLIRPVAALGALAMAGIAFGALVAHAVNAPLIAAIPALVLFVLALVLAYRRAPALTRTLFRLFPPEP